jgi:hypothetical protein
MVLKLTTQSARDLFETQKKVDILSTFDLHSMNAIAMQWRDALPSIDNVDNGLCLTLLLPHLLDLRVSLSKGRVVRILAKRTVLTGDKYANKANTRYEAEFELQGINERLTERDMNYRYSSETGLLHIYLEGLCSPTSPRGGKESKSDGRSGLSALDLCALRNSFLRLISH